MTYARRKKLYGYMFIMPWVVGFLVFQLTPMVWSLFLSFNYYDIITPVEADRHAGIVTFSPRRESSASLFEQLRGAGVACALRGGGVRFSPHYYTPRKKLFAALELLSG